MLHPGRTQRAREAALSHTGALAGDHAVMATVLEHEGVLLVDTLDELFDVTPLLRALARRRSPRARRSSPIPARSAASRSISAPRAGSSCRRSRRRPQAALKAMLPPYAAIDNPLDITTIGIAQPEVFGKTARGDARRSRRSARSSSPSSRARRSCRWCARGSLLPVIEQSRKPVAFSHLRRRDAARAGIHATGARARHAALPLARPRAAGDGAARRITGAHRCAQPRRAAAVARRFGSCRTRGSVPEYRAKAYLAAPGIARARRRARAHDGRGARDRRDGSAIRSCSRRRPPRCRTRAMPAA